MVHFHSVGLLETLSDDVDFLTGWFNVISKIVEPNGFGTKYPYLFNKLYRSGKNIFLSPQDGLKLLEELDIIKEILKSVEFNYALISREEHFKKASNIDKYINSDAKNMYEAFNAVYNENLFECIYMGVKYASKMKFQFKIDSYASVPGTIVPHIPKEYQPQKV